jgi:hypothetical protein
MISTNIVLSDRPIFAFFKAFADYYLNFVTPYPIYWWTIEGFWPGFQLQRQEEVPNQNATIVAGQRIVIKPISIEIEERLNFPWRLNVTDENQAGNATDIMASHFLPPLFASPELSIWLKFLRIRGNFELDVHAWSSPFIFDTIMNVLRRFNNRYTYIPAEDFTLVIPIKLINSQSTDWTKALQDSTAVSYSYLGITGEEYYYFNIPVHPLIKISAPAYTHDNPGETYTATFSFEFNTSLPVSMLLVGPAVAENIWLRTTYDSLNTNEYMAAMVDYQTIGFRPRGYVTINNLTNTVNITSAEDLTRLRTVYIDDSTNGVGVFDVTSTFVVTKTDTSRYQVSVTVTDPAYIANPTLFQTRPVTFYWGWTNPALNPLPGSG